MESLVEGRFDEFSELMLLGCEFNPLVMDGRNNLSVLLHELFIGVINGRLVITASFRHDGFLLNVRNQIEVLDLAGTSGRQDKIVDFLLMDQVCLNLNRIIEHYADVEKRVETSWRLVSLRTRFVEVHPQDQVQTIGAAFVQLFQPRNHV